MASKCVNCCKNGIKIMKGKTDSQFIGEALCMQSPYIER